MNDITVSMIITYLRLILTSLEGNAKENLIFEETKRQLEEEHETTIR